MNMLAKQNTDDIIEERDLDSVVGSGRARNAIIEFNKTMQETDDGGARSPLAQLSLAILGGVYGFIKNKESS